ncbi:MAG: (d)CMP kinase [Saprospiraceae bacterium]
MKNIVIAIDGFSACGKSTLAKALAHRLGYGYVDTGAMYRAVTLYFIRHSIDEKNEVAVADALRDIHITFQADPERGNRTLLNGEDVEDEIRQLAVARRVSPVAAVSAVRRAMVAQQRRLGAAKGIVMDGRDIGTVVFPEAELKLFVTASEEERTRRRYTELTEQGRDVTLAEVAENLRERDTIDSTRADSPLRRADDAVVIDNTTLTPEEQLERAIMLVREQAGS